MPTKQASAKSRSFKEQRTRSVGRAWENAPCASEPGEDHAYLVRNGNSTHVLVPIDEYERLVKAETVDRLLAKLEDPKTEWVNADDFAIELATESVVKARKAAGLTQAQLAKKLGMPQSQISRIERNPDRTTVRTLKKIAKALRVDVSAFMNYVSKS